MALKIPTPSSSNATASRKRSKVGCLRSRGGGVMRKALEKLTGNMFQTTGEVSSIRPRRHNISSRPIDALTTDVPDNKSTPQPKPLQSWGNSVYNTSDNYSYNLYNDYANNIKTVYATKVRVGVKGPLVPSVNIIKNPGETSKTKPVEQPCGVPRIKENLRQYLLKTTLHGLRYIGEGTLSWIERIFWFIAFMMALFCAAYYILNIYSRWRTNPMIVSVNADSKALTSIPFPAITICNLNQAKLSVAERISKEGSEIDKKLLESVCTVNESAILEIESTPYHADWGYFKQFLINVTQPCSEMLALCKWKSEVKPCENLFNTQLTDQGLCCTFNAVHREKMFRNPREVSDLNITFPFPAVDWTPENGYPADAPVDGFPWRPIGAGANLGLVLVLDAAIAEYYCSSMASAGFKILLHNPAETPKMAEYGELVSAGDETSIIIKPIIYDFDEKLTNIKLDKRKCVFAGEKQLDFYRTYTQKNCAMECEARLTVERCGCNQYYMPKNRSTRICGNSDAKCYIELKSTYAHYLANHNFVAIDDKLGVNESSLLMGKDCDDCYPACSELSYGKDLSLTHLTDRFRIRSEMLAGRKPSYFKSDMAVVHFYFVDTSFTRYTKGEIFGFTEFLSNTGGLLGLFMGFSFMSIIEIIYFLTLRVLCSYFREVYVKERRVNKQTVYPYTE